MSAYDEIILINDKNCTIHSREAYLKRVEIEEDEKSILIVFNINIDTIYTFVENMLCFFKNCGEKMGLYLNPSQMEIIKGYAPIFTSLDEIEIDGDYELYKEFVDGAIFSMVLNYVKELKEEELFG